MRLREHPEESDLAWTSFSAMGPEVRLAVHPAARLPACAARTRSWFAAVEGAASRFAPDSQLNQLAQGRRSRPSPLLAELRAAAEAVAELTGGIVTPYERRSLEAAGYDRSFELLTQPAEARAPTPFTDWGRLDFGGVGKGWTVDRALADLAPLCGGALLDAGGDVGVVGDGPQGRPWWIRVDPASAGLRVAVRGGGVATSSTLRRTWTGPAGRAHHLIDPRTGRPARSDVVQASAWARSALSAEVAAKALVIGGSETAGAIRRWFPEAVLCAVWRDGSVHADPAFREEVLQCAS